MRRRKFITFLGGAAAWPIAVRAQQPVKLPIIGLLGSSTALIESQRVAAFVQRLHQLGWIENRNATYSRHERAIFSFPEFRFWQHQRTFRGGERFCGVVRTATPCRRMINARRHIHGWLDCCLFLLERYLFRLSVLRHHRRIIWCSLFFKIPALLPIFL